MDFDFCLGLDFDFCFLNGTAGTLLNCAVLFFEVLRIFFFDLNGTIDFLFALFRVMLVIVFSLLRIESRLYLPKEV